MKQEAVTDLLRSSVPAGLARPAGPSVCVSPSTVSDEEDRTVGTSQRTCRRTRHKWRREEMSGAARGDEAKLVERRRDVHVR